MNWNKLLLNTPIIFDTTENFTYSQQRSESNCIADHFNQFLQAHMVVTQVLKEEVFKIRHEVYCKELAFKDIRDDKQESDEFDNRSVFSLIQHKPSKKFTSCIRLVTSNASDELLPIEKYCLSSITNKALNPTNFKRAEIGEISRLAIKFDFRRRKADKFKRFSTGVMSECSYSETELRCFSLITIGLYMTAAMMSIKRGIRHVYVMMEPKLARSVKFIGVNFQQIGPPTNYWGLRAPYYINAEYFIKNLSPEFTKLYKVIEKDTFTAR